MNEFKIRCSAIHNIIAQPKSKSENISVGAKTFCKKWLIENMFERREEIKSKYIQKGLDTEEQALNVLVRVLKLSMIYKNEERKTDDYKTGEIDFIHDGIIYDNKSSFSIHTFPLFEDKLDPIYYAQQQGYMDLWNIDKAKVCYTLVDTPFDILEKEVKWLNDDDEKQKKALSLVFTSRYWDDVKQRLFPNAKDIKFKSIEDRYRLKVFEVDREKDFINNVHIKVKGCREYINQLVKSL